MTRFTCLTTWQRWHPDKAVADPEEAKGRFQKIHEAYQVLSDDKRRALYDAGMYDPLDADDPEGFHDFLQEMLSLIRRDEPVYSLAELQAMLDGMIQDFAAPQPGFFAGAGFGGDPAAAEPPQAPSSRVHPQHRQGVGDAACFTRTAFSR